MATFRTYAEILRPDHPMMKIRKATTAWRPSRYRPAEIEQAMRAEPGVVVGDVLQRTGGAYETTTRLTPKFREDARETAELTSDDELLRIAELPEVAVSLEHLRRARAQVRLRSEDGPLSVLSAESIFGTHPCAWSLPPRWGLTARARQRRGSKHAANLSPRCALSRSCS